MGRGLLGLLCDRWELGRGRRELVKERVAFFVFTECVGRFEGVDNEGNVTNEMQTMDCESERRLFVVFASCARDLSSATDGWRPRQ